MIPLAFLATALNSISKTIGMSEFEHRSSDTFSILLNPLLAVASLADLKTKLKEVLNMVMAFGFLYGTIRIIGGAMQIRRGETEEGKHSIISGTLIAAAPMIMRILYGIFFDGDPGL